jgi:two-component system sensor histidine kinase HydH
MPETLFDEMKRYVRFEPADEAALRSLAPRAEPHFERIVDVFYTRLLEHDRASRVLRDSAQVKRLRGTLRQWLGELVAGPWDEAYYERRARIGRVHVKIALPQRFMFGAMNVVRIQLAGLACELAETAERRDAVLAALHKILDIELSIMLETYRDAIIDIRTRRAERLAALGTMAAGLAHELRNPLNAAQLQLSLAERKLAGSSTPAPKRARHAVAVAQTELKRLAGLVSDFLQFAKPNPLELKRIDLLSLAKQLHELLRPEAAEFGVTLLLEPGSSLELDVDEAKMKQVMLNLMRNAIEASPRGATVRTRIETDGEQGRLIVEDAGPGIAPDAPIFEPFFTTKSNGTGLGLAIVHRIVLDHAGTVHVESRPGLTQFSVSLPLRAS